MLVAALVTGLVTGVARADGNGDSHVVTSAQAEVTVDNQRVFDDAFRIVESEGAVVNAANYTHAKGCQGCQAVAISFQIVLVQEPPENITPENALWRSTSCVTSATPPPAPISSWWGATPPA